MNISLAFDSDHQFSIISYLHHKLVLISIDLRNSERDGSLPNIAERLNSFSNWWWNCVSNRLTRDSKRNKQHNWIKVFEFNSWKNRMKLQRKQVHADFIYHSSFGLDGIETGAVLNLVSISPCNGYHLKRRYKCGFILSMVILWFHWLAMAIAPYFKNYTERLLFGELRIKSVTLHSTVHLCYDVLRSSQLIITLSSIVWNDSFWKLLRTL